MKKILRKYCLRLILVFLLILGACIPMALVSYQVMKNQVIESSQHRLEEGAQQLNRIMEQMIAVVQSAKQNTYVDSLSWVDGDLAADQYLNLPKANDFLHDLGQVYGFSPYCFVLFRDNDIFLSSDQCNSKFTDAYYGAFMKIWEDGEEWSAAQVREKLFNNESPYFFWAPERIQFYLNNSLQEIQQPIFCVIRGNVDNWLERSSIVVFILDPEDVAAQISTGYYSEREPIRIQDRFGEVLLQKGEVGMLPMEQDSASAQMDGQTYQILTASADSMGWKIEIGISEEQIAQQVQEVIQLIAWYFVLGILVIFGIVLVLVYRQFRSVQKLWTLLPTDQGTYGRRTDEYAILSTVFGEIKENLDQYREQAEQMREENRTIMLENYIVHGRFPEDGQNALDDILKELPEFYCLALIQMKEEETRQQAVRLFFTKVLEQAGIHIVFRLHTDVQEELFLFAMEPSDRPTAKRIRGILDESSRILLTEQGIVIHAGISTVGTGMDNLPVCYQQAKQILTAYRQEKQYRVEAYHSGWREMNDRLADMEYLQKLANLITCGERTAAEELIDQLVPASSKNPMAFEIQKPQIFYSIRSVLYHIYGQYGLKTREDMPLPDFSQEEKAEDMARRLTQAANHLIDQMEEKKRGRNLQLKNQILEYVEEHFGDAELTAKKLCGQIGISEKYLVQYLKEQTGESFAVFLERTRVEKAAEYLKNTDWTNEFIAKKCGFAALNTFYRVFHKKMGVSPGVYRKENSAMNKHSP